MFNITGGLVGAQNTGGAIAVQPLGVLNWTGGSLTAGVTVNGGVANMSTMPALRMEPGGVLTVNSGTANLPTSGIITSDNGGVVINNTGAAMNTTALNISASNGSQVVFNPG